MINMPQSTEPKENQMKKQKLLIWAWMILAMGGTASAEVTLCPKCSESGFTSDIGKCKECGGETASGGVNLCDACAEEKNQCQACLEPRKAADTKADDLKVPIPAEPTKVAIAKEWKSFHSGETGQKRVVIKNQKEWEAVWTVMTGNVAPKPATPVVDFDSQVILAVFMGKRNSGGYSVSIADITDVDAKRVVRVVENNPPRDAITAAVLTSPYHVVLVTKTDLPVVFEDQN